MFFWGASRRKGDLLKLGHTFDRIWYFSCKLFVCLIWYFCSQTVWRQINFAAKLLENISAMSIIPSHWWILFLFWWFLISFLYFDDFLFHLYCNNLNFDDDDYCDRSRVGPITPGLDTWYRRVCHRKEKNTFFQCNSRLLNKDLDAMDIKGTLWNA